MERIPVSELRSRFREVLEALGPRGVAVERHGRAVAYIVPADDRWIARDDAERREARLRQAVVEEARLNKHLKIGMRLLSVPRPEARTMLAQASQQVDRWERDKLCSPDYIARWRKILALPLGELVEKMCGDPAGWGKALRQNSPWVGHEHRPGL